MTPSTTSAPGEIRRIDRYFADVATGLWGRMLRRRDHLWLWWRYSFREPLTDPDGANHSLNELCGYQVLPRIETRMKCCIPMLRRWRFGVLIFFVPIEQKSRYWTLCWVRWVDDPLEFYLVRSAPRGLGCDEHGSPSQSADSPLLSSLDDVSEELDGLLSVQAESPQPSASRRR